MVRTTRAESDLGRPVTASTTSIPDVASGWAVVPVYNPAPALLAVYPRIWGACLACHISGDEVKAVDFFNPLIKHLAVVIAVYSACRALDATLDPSPEELDVPTSSRAIILAAGYPCWAVATTGLIYHLQGPSRIIFWVPTWILGSLSVIAKHCPVLKHASLGLANTFTLLTALELTSLPMNENLLLLAAFTFFWTLYVSVLYTSMAPASSTDYCSHHNYTSTSPVTHAALRLLALFQITMLSIYTYGTGKSLHFWVLGVGGWVVSNVWHIRDLGSVEWLWNERAGQVAVLRNLGLGGWLAGAEVVELWLDGLMA